MGSKHKQAQAVRRAARDMLSTHKRGLRDKLSQFNTILKPKPKWCHQKLWSWGASIFLDTKKAEELFK